MYRITDPKRSGAFYEALGFRSRRELPIVRDGELEATNYFFGMPDDEAELELTSITTEVATTSARAYGHIAVGVDDLDATLERLKKQGIEPERLTTLSDHVPVAVRSSPNRRPSPIGSRIALASCRNRISRRQTRFRTERTPR